MSTESFRDIFQGMASLSTEETEIVDLEYQPDSRSKTPVSVITGFLGSGKTLLDALLEPPRMAETTVLANEFGEIGIDHLLVEAPDDDVLLPAAGCLCCTIREDMVAGLRSLFERRAGGQVPVLRAAGSPVRGWMHRRSGPLVGWTRRGA